MRTIILAGLIALLASLGSLLTASAEQRPYSMDQPCVSHDLNTLWSVLGVSEASDGITPNQDAVNNVSCEFEWESLKLAWTNLPLRASLRKNLMDASVSGINAAGSEPKGYVYPATNDIKWFGLDYHFDQQPRFINAVYDYYAWTKDTAFLKAMQPKIEAAMDYMMNIMKGKEGLPITPDPYNGISNTGRPSTYMDCYREGYEVTWILESYYTSLLDMAKLETALGDPIKASHYASDANKFPSEFNRLWNPVTHRYVGWRDSNGGLHDYGFTYINLEALARGLGDAGKAYRIFQWLDHGKAQPTAAGAHIGSEDIYQCIAAPRSNTIRIPTSDWVPWSVSETLRNTLFKYGTLVEDGGSELLWNYYDVMARLRWLDANDAWRKFADMVYRAGGDPLMYTEVATNHPLDVYGENYLEFAANGGENGLAGLSPLYGFMGLRPGLNGLYASPNLPTSLVYLKCDDISYGSHDCSVKVVRGRIVYDYDLFNNFTVLGAAGTSSTFKTENGFNSVGALLYLDKGVHQSGYYIRTIQNVVLPVMQPTVSHPIRIKLERLEGGKWAAVAMAIADTRYSDAWLYARIAHQPAGTYRLTLTDSSKSFSWLNQDGVYDIRAVDEPVTKAEIIRVHGAKVSLKASKSFSAIHFAGTGSMRYVKLYRKMGGFWWIVRVTWASSPHGGVLSFADQPKGNYKLAFDKPFKGVGALESSLYLVTVTSDGKSSTQTVGAGGKVRLSIP